MKQILRTVALLSAAFFVFSCGGGSDANSANESGELPEGINTKPLETGTNSNPGIPANTNVAPASGEPTPGIPSNGNIAMELPKGATPTPGIPDPETIRRQMERKDVDANIVNRPARTVPEGNVKTKDPMGRPRRTNSN